MIITSIVITYTVGLIHDNYHGTISQFYFFFVSQQFHVLQFVIPAIIYLNYVESIVNNQPKTTPNHQTTPNNTQTTPNMSHKLPKTLSISNKKKQQNNNTLILSID